MMKNEDIDIISGASRTGGSFLFPEKSVIFYLISAWKDDGNVD